VTLVAKRTLTDGVTGITKGTSTIAATSGDASVTLYATADCATTVLGNLSIAEGASTATFYARGRSAATTTFTNVNINASETNGGLAPATALVVKSYPLVRRGTCTSGVNATSVDCPVAGIPAADNTRTFLMFQASTGAQSSAAPAMVECHLVGTTNIQCTRNTSAGPALTIQWQTVSWGRPASGGGMTVQHFSQAVGAAAPLAVTIPAVSDLSQTFLLFSMTSTQTGPIKPTDMFTARLTSTTTVEFDTSVTNVPAGTASFQVVQLSGARVDRGKISSAGAVASVAATFSLSSPATARLSPLLSAQTDTTNSDGCKMRFRGSMSGATMTAARGNGTSTCFSNLVERVAWEIIEWPVNTTVASTTITMANTIATDSTWAPAVASDRTVLYLAQQGPLGQSGGEGQSGASPIDNQSGLLSWPTAVKLDRASAGISVFTPFAVTFSP
jgi:hypothetical protein